jgi:hypothetical protein
MPSVNAPTLKSCLAVLNEEDTPQRSEKVESRPAIRTPPQKQSN